MIREWNSIYSFSTATILEPVLWETHTYPSIGARPQEIINRQIVDNSDILVGTFWTRLGTPTGEAESGTAEEIERFRTTGKPVMLYFSTVPVQPQNIDAREFAALTDYRNRLQQQGLIYTYESEQNLREQFRRHLSSQMINSIRENGGQGQTAPVATSASDSQFPQFRQFIDRFASFLRRFDAEWSSERDSGPLGIQEAQLILSHALQDVIELRSFVTEDPSGTVSGPLEEAARQLRQLLRHQLYIDGGRSFRAFWDGGNTILELLSRLHSELSQIRR